MPYLDLCLRLVMIKISMVTGQINGMQIHSNLYLPVFIPIVIYKITMVQRPASYNEEFLKQDTQESGKLDGSGRDMIYKIELWRESTPTDNVRTCYI